MKETEKKIIEIIDKIRPFLISDGGNIEYIKYENIDGRLLLWWFYKNKKTLSSLFIAAQCGHTISDNPYLHSPCKFVNLW